MKLRNIFGISLVAALVFTSACTQKEDMSKVDEWLGEKFNQEILWDVDSMAFRRTDWASEDVASGLQMRKAQIKMWESVQSISYVNYSPNMFNTYLGYTGAEGTVGDIAGSYEGALFAINAGDLTGGKPTNFFKLDGEVIVGKVNVDEQADLAAAYGVMSIPTIILFKDGDEADRSIGAKSKEALLEFLGK